MDSTKLQTILYVDDEADIRAVIEMALSMEEGLTAHACESGEQALSIMEEIKPDLVLLDVLMPGMDGPTTLRQMRQNPTLVDVPVIFMTAKVMPQEVVALRESGAIGVIPKPFDPMTLSRQVFTLWEKSPRTNPRADIHEMRTRLGQLGADFLKRALEDVSRLEALLSKPDVPEPATLKQVERLAHHIRGAAATFGIATISHCAGEIERIAAESTGAGADPRSMTSIALKTAKLREILEKLAQTV